MLHIYCKGRHGYEALLLSDVNVLLQSQKMHGCMLNLEICSFTELFQTNVWVSILTLSSQRGMLSELGKCS